MISRRQLISLVASVALVVVAGAALVSSSSTSYDSGEIGSHGIEKVVMTESGYIVVLLAQHTVADTVVLSDAIGNPMTAKPLTKSHESVVLKPIHDKRVTFNSTTNAEPDSLTLPGSLVPDEHPKSEVELLNSGEYKISLLANGTVTETETVNLTASFLMNYTR